ncbi:MAG: aryl-sulfate sulfotransferase [Saprospiraceae bacterium]|nr:aryl-sulfate sulfotransferase [Saprospiraceae bacterium]
MTRIILLLFCLHTLHAGAQLLITDLQVEAQSDNVLRYEIDLQTNVPARTYAAFEQNGQIRHSSISATGVDHQLTVYGLLAETDYELTVHAFDPSGQTTQQTVEFTTGSLPAGLVQPAATLGTSVDSLDFVSMDVLFGNNQQVQIFDRNGRTVWYQLLSVPGIPCLGYKWTKNNTLLYLHASCHTIEEIDLAGNVLRQVEVSNFPVQYYVHHEFLLNQAGNLLVLVAEGRTIDKSSVGGPADAQVVGDGFLEIDWQGNILKKWSAFDHFDPLTSVDLNNYWDEHFGPGAEDWLHANSLAIDTDGHYLLSMSIPNQIVKIHRETGEILWTLGQGGDFTILPPDAVFAGQHSVTGLGDQHYLLFDNKGGLADGAYSRTSEFVLDEAAGTATLVYTQEANQAIYTPVVGGAQRLPNGHTLTCFGQKGVTKEADENGQEVWSLNLANFSYRAYHLPTLDPAIAAPQPAAFCISPDATPFSPTVEPDGGYFTGDYIFDGLFDPQSAGLGEHQVWYTFGWESFPLTITVAEPMAAPAIVQVGALLTASGGSSYQWYLDGEPIPGATADTLLAEEEGFYSVEAFFTTGCGALSESVYVSLVSTTTEAAVQFDLFPNPTSGLVELRSSVALTGKVFVFDLYGRLIREDLLQETRNRSWELHGLPPGCYLWKLETQKGTAVKRIILQ